MKILIVEDQTEIRDTLRDMLEINGHDVIAAEDGVERLKMAAQQPEFIFCDVEMPNLDGYGMLAEIKKMSGVCDVPFIFLTARAERSALREGMASGADDYITKPFSEADLVKGSPRAPTGSAACATGSTNWPASSAGNQRPMVS